MRCEADLPSVERRCEALGLDAKVIREGIHGGGRCGKLPAAALVGMRPKERRIPMQQKEEPPVK